jgi:hypothetical protein
LWRITITVQTVVLDGCRHLLDDLAMLVALLQDEGQSFGCNSVLDRQQFQEVVPSLENYFELVFRSGYEELFLLAELDSFLVGFHFQEFPDLASSFDCRLGGGPLGERQFRVKHETGKASWLR